MAPPPPPKSSRVSEFYERKRRLSYYFAWLSMVLLLVELSLGFVLEFFSYPRLAAAEEGFTLFHRCLSREETDGSRFVRLDAAMKIQGEPLQLLDSASAALLEGRDLSVFYGSRASVLTDGKNTRAVDLGQKWDVLAALLDPGRRAAWIFGWKEGSIVARRRDQGAWGPETVIAPSGLVERLSACLEGNGGPLVAWREKNSPRIRTAIFDGQAFALRPEFDLGEAQHWDAVLAQGRIVVACHHRDDRSFDSVTLRIECCPGCPSPLPPHKVAFADPVLLLGRKITGLSMLLTGDRVRLLVTRPSRILWASLPAATFEPESGAAKLLAIDVHSLWRNVIGSITPTLLLFCSTSLVFLGFTMLRERKRSMEGSAPSEPTVATLASRTMAYLLDLVLLWPVFYAVVGFLDVPVDDLNDPRFLWVLLIGAFIDFAYHFAMEWGLGWTFGKRIIGLRVTGIDGERVGFQGALIRNVSRILDGTIPFSWILGVAAMLRTPRRQRLGDVAARTMVLQDLRF